MTAGALAFAIAFAPAFAAKAAPLPENNDGAAIAVDAPSAPNIAAKAAVLIDVGSGQVIYEKNADDRLPMASTTKVMTALVALENGNLSDIVVVPPQASGVEGSSMYLEPGENITLENLLYGLMLWSGNDAAVAIALHIGSTIEGFAQMMNARAKEIGATNTNFTNPNGLPAAEHYTTARDLGLIAAHAMRNPVFRTIVATKQRTIGWEGHEYDRSLTNHNKMLHRYEGANGIKTGFTKSAGRCLVTGALRDGVQLVSVVLNCSDMYGESARMLDYGFASLEQVTALTAGQEMGVVPVQNGIEAESITLRAQRDVTATIRKGQSDSIRTEIDLPEAVEAPVTKGQKIGSIRVYIGDVLIDEQDLCAEIDISPITYGYYLDKALRDWLLMPA